MLYTPNMTQINVEHNGHRWTEALAISMWAPMRSMPSFDYLEVVHVTGRMNLRQLVPLLHTTSLRRLSLSSIYDVGDEPLPDLEQAISPACSNVEDLELFDCIFDIPALATLFNSLRALKRLRCQLMLSLLEDDTGHQLLTILERHKNSLQRLDLHVFADEPAGEEPRSALFMDDRLCAFSSLKQLRCPLSSLQDMNVDSDPPVDPSADLSSTIKERLPSSLTALEIDIRHRTREENHGGTIERFADNLPEGLRCFRSVFHRTSIGSDRISLRCSPQQASYFWCLSAKIPGVLLKTQKQS